MNIGVISGRFIPKFFNNLEEVIIDTAFGEIPVIITAVGDHQVFFIQRHGAQGNLPPHKVNYHGNIQALYASHVDHIISLGTVGSLNAQMKPGDVVIPHDFIDNTKNRMYSYFDAKRVHVDMSESFCPNVRVNLIKQAQALKGLTVHEEGVSAICRYCRDDIDT
jgi:5'-methylthioadenosine phosphorylase